MLATRLPGRRHESISSANDGRRRLAALGFALIVAGWANAVAKSGAFFGASACLLAACLCMAGVTCGG
jgi:hypothetical protein